MLSHRPCGVIPYYSRNSQSGYGRPSMCPHGFRALRRFHLHNLHGFRQDQLAIHTLLTDKSDQTIGSIQFFQLCNAACTTVADVVVGEVTECHDYCTLGDLRHISGGVHRIAQNTIRLPCGQRRLPQIVPVAVFQLPDLCQRRIAGDKCGIFPVRPLQLIHKVDDLICLDAVCGGRNADFTAAGGVQDARGLILAISGQERFFLGIAQCLCKAVQQRYGRGFQVPGCRLRSSNHSAVRLHSRSSDSGNRRAAGRPH